MHCATATQCHPSLVTDASHECSRVGTGPAKVGIREVKTWILLLESLLHDLFLDLLHAEGVKLVVALEHAWPWLAFPHFEQSVMQLAVLHRPKAFIFYNLVEEETAQRAQ